MEGEIGRGEGMGGDKVGGGACPERGPAWQAQGEAAALSAWLGVLPAPVCRELHWQAPRVDCRLQ